MTDKSQTLSAIKPCPFCGGKRILAQPWHGGGPDKHIVGCHRDTCNSQPSVTGETKAEAIRNWNSRKSVAGYATEYHWK